MNKMIEVKRGDIWWVNLSKGEGKNSLQYGNRPFLIVANENCIKYSSIITGVALTSNIEKLTQKKLPTHVFIDKKFGLPTDSIALCEQPRPIDKNELISKSGQIDSDTMTFVESSLMIQFGININCNDTNKNKIARQSIDINLAKTLLISINQLDNINTKQTKPIIDIKVLVTQFIEYCRKFNTNHKYIAHKIKDMLSNELLTWNTNTYGLLF